MKKIIYCIKSVLFILLQSVIAILIAWAMLTLLSCSSVPITGGEKCASYQQTDKEINDILKHGDNLTQAQRIVLQHASADLKDAQKQNKQTASLQTQLIKSSEKAGAGKLIYNIMYFAAFLVAAFLGFKLMKKFSLF